MNKKRFFLLVLIVPLFVASFFVGEAYAASGCFNDTNNKWYSKATCWMKKNKLESGTLFYPDNATTRAQAAVWLQKQSQIPPTQGLINISEGFGNWKPFNSTDNVSFETYSNVVYFKKSTTGSNYFSLHPSIPTVFYGRSLQLLGVEFCYTASASAVFSYIEINTYTHTDSAGPRTLQYSDDTDRTDSACRYYTLPTAVTLTAEDGVNIFIQGIWTSANSPLILGRTTFVLKPTGVKAAVPSNAETDVILQEGGIQAGGRSTSAP